MIGEKHFKVQIKGVREGLLITLGEGEWQVLQQELMQHIADQSSFFQGAKVALDVGNQILHAAELGSLRDKLADKGVSLWAILSNSPKTEQTAQMLGLATRLSAPRPERVIHKLIPTLPVIIRYSSRRPSGRVSRFPRPGM
jgi:septum site-determining protein MinC